MHFHTNHVSPKFILLLTVLTLLLNSCGYERIGHNPYLGETGESYSADEMKSQELPSQDPQHLFDAFCLSVFQNEMEESSTLDLHYTLLNPEAYGIDPSPASLGTYLLEDMIANNAAIKELKSELLTYDRNTLTDSQKVTYDALLETLNIRLMSEGLELYEQPLAPTIGIQAQLPILLAEYAFHSEKDVEDYLSLVEQIDEYYGEILEFEQQKAAAGLGPSDASIDAIIASCEGYLGEISNNVLSETFTERLETLDAAAPITDQKRSDYIARHNTAISDHFIPAYQHLITGMSALKGRGINDGGLAGFQDGADYYEYLVRSGPATSYSVLELKEALTARMEQDLREMSQLFVTYPDLEDRLASANFSLNHPEEILEDLKVKMAVDYPELPDCDYAIRYVPESLEDVLSPAFYLIAPLDDTDQNVIYINNAFSNSALYTTLAHEGFPGHLYQTIYSRSRQQDSPLCSVLSYSGANEGWATYVEHYSYLYDNGLPEGVGRYQALLRSYSLCVHGILDIGINYEGWDHETANRFISSCFQVDEATMNELWQVMIDNPANYLCYCGGFVEIMEMRDEAELALGGQFSAKEFHKFLLDIGPVPFSVIRTHFNEWLHSQI